MVSDNHRKKFRGNWTFSQYFSGLGETISKQQFQAFSGAFHGLSTALDRQITPQFTTFQQHINGSQQIIHRFFLRR